jgi:hypothetical protein
MKIRRSERGQALAEYHVLIPGSILLAGFMLPVIAGGVNSIYCEVANTLDDDVCMEINGEVVPTEEEEECIVHPMDGGSSCDQSDFCSLYDVPYNEGTVVSPYPIQSLVLKAGQDYHIFNSGLTEDGCYNVEFSVIDGFQAVGWQKVGPDKECHDVSHIESWNVLICIPQ